jgi:hypothetical protein
MILSIIRKRLLVKIVVIIEVVNVALKVVYAFSKGFSIFLYGIKYLLMTFKCFFNSWKCQFGRIFFRFDYLTSRRYPYNKTMTELVDDIRREQHYEKLRNETSSRYLADTPRVVETSYYDPLVKDFPNILFFGNHSLWRK